MDGLSEQKFSKADENDRKKEIRAKRRFDELNSKGFMVTLDEVMKNIQDRDYTDTHRSESPLRQAEDAIILDNSNLTEQEQFQFALNLIKELNVPIPV
jgi:cytidylate kinase